MQLVVSNRVRGDPPVEEGRISASALNRFDAAQLSQKKDRSLVPPEGSCTG
jgi:hypothetical protein